MHLSDWEFQLSQAVIWAMEYVNPWTILIWRKALDIIIKEIIYLSINLAKDISETGTIPVPCLNCLHNYVVTTYEISTLLVWLVNTIKA